MKFWSSLTGFSEGINNIIRNPTHFLPHWIFISPRPSGLHDCVVGVIFWRDHVIICNIFWCDAVIKSLVKNMTRYIRLKNALWTNFGDFRDRDKGKKICAMVWWFITRGLLQLPYWLKISNRIQWCIGVNLFHPEILFFFKRKIFQSSKSTWFFHEKNETAWHLL